jgi:hypothetical protein
MCNLTPVKNLQFHETKLYCTKAIIFQIKLDPLNKYKKIKCQFLILKSSEPVSKH